MMAQMRKRLNKVNHPTVDVNITNHLLFESIAAGCSWVKQPDIWI